MHHPGFVPPLLFAAAALAAGLLPPSRARAADPQLESWQTAATRRYARIYETDAARIPGPSVPTWSAAPTAEPPADPTYPPKKPTRTAADASNLPLRAGHIFKDYQFSVDNQILLPA